MKNRAYSYVIALGLAAFATGGVADVALASDKVVATINGKPVTDADLAIAESEIGSDMGTLPEAQKRMSLLEFLIDNQLFAEAAEAEKLGQGAEFETRLNYLKRRALRELYFDKVIKASVSDAEARKFYDDQVKLIKPEEEVHARHILVESEDKAKELKAKIAAGGDFVTIAKENTKDTGSKEDGGNLGYFGRGQMVPQFEEAVFKMQKGDVSEPIQTQFGWHLIKVEDRRVKAPPAYDVVKDRIVQSMLLRKAQESAVNLRSKATIEFVDPEIKKSIEERNKAMQAPPGGAAPAAPGAAAPPAPAEPAKP